jgi:hypothetical protein
VVLWEQSVVLRVVSLPDVPVLLLDAVLSPVCEPDEDPAEPSARRIVPELCVLPVSALGSGSDPEPMLWHPASPAPTTVDATIAIQYRLFMSHLVLLLP